VKKRFYNIDGFSNLLRHCFNQPWILFRLGVSAIFV
jgi:hypothetical protein